MREYTKGMVSVVIPTYGRSDTLKRAVKSVKKQTYNNIEILVVDDNEPGSEYSQRVAEIINYLNYDNLSLVTQDRHINGAVARNKGIKVAKGEYIAFLDDDDLFLPEKIKKQVTVLEKLDGSYGAVSSQKIYLKNNVVDGVSDIWHDNQHQNFDIITRKINVSTCTLLMRHTCLDETGYFDERLKRNQEIQLLAFFTLKYRIKLIEELLTIIDCTDVTNRQNSKQILSVKQMYLKAIEPVMLTYTKHKQKLIIAHNMIDIIRVYLRERKIKNAIYLLSRTLVYPSVIWSFCKFVFLRVTYRKTKGKVAPETIRAVDQLIRGE